MKIRIFINPSRARRWHLMLADRFMAMGHDVAFAFIEGGPSLNPVISILTAFERLIYRKPDSFASRRAPFSLFAGLTKDMSEADLIINLTGRTVDHQCRILRLLFDGLNDECAAVAAILAGRAPYLSVVDNNGNVIFSGLPAIERSQLLSTSFDAILVRCITILSRALINVEIGYPLSSPLENKISPPVRLETKQFFKFGSQVLIRKIRAKLYRMANKIDHENQDHWRIAWRKCKNQDQLTAGFKAWPKTEWSILQDDNERFYADPFIFEYKDRIYLFCEEFPYSTMKGVISVATITPDHGISKPVPVLERPFHLSYPFVFEHDNEIWMIPETYSSGKIELYRAENFPDRWVFEKVLVDDVVASDTTFFEHNGLLWLFATDHDGGSSWDTLSLWFAKDLKGPWNPHRLNPVLVDARSARPGGKLAILNNRIIRPTQNCVGGYGTGLVLKEITHLDENSFVEHEVADLPPLPEWNVVGVHTLNHGAGFEVIDQLGTRAKPG